MKLNIRVSACAAVVMGLVTSSTRSATPQSQSRIPLSAPAVISQDGYYYLATDITGTIISPVFVIEADKVTLDLRGHRIDIPGSGIGVLFAFAGQGQKRIRITNGILSGGNVGVSLSASPSYWDARFQVDHLTLDGQTGLGIHLDNIGSASATAIVRNNLVFNCGGYGIATYGLASASVRANLLLQGGILEINGGSDSGHRATVIGNEVSLSAGFVLSHLSFCTIKGNKVQSNSSGLFFQDVFDSKIVHNTVSGNSGDGIFTNTCRDNLFESNQVDSNTGDGISLATPGTADNSVLHNALRRNSGCGLFIGDGVGGVIEVGNTIRDNLLGDVCDMRTTPP